MPSDTVRELALDIAQRLEQQQAEKIVVLEVAELTSIADYFVVSTGKNTRHLKALAREVSDLVRKRDKKLLGREGDPESGWMLVDTGDIIVHIFDQQRRGLYNMEMLWGDARELTAR